MFTFTFFVCNYYRSSLSRSLAINRSHQYIFVSFILLFFLFPHLCIFCFYFLVCFLLFFTFFLNLPYAQIKSLFLLIFSFFACSVLSLLSDFFSLLFCKLFPQVINNKSYTIIIIINNETNVLPMVPA